MTGGISRVRGSVEVVELVLRPLLGPMRLDHAAHVHADAPVPRRSGMLVDSRPRRAGGVGNVRDRRVRPRL